MLFKTIENANTLNQFDLCKNIKLQSMDVSIFVALLLLDFYFYHTTYFA